MQIDFHDLVPSQLHLIDFGSSMSYILNQNREKMTHLPNKILFPPITRNMFFASPHYFSGQTMSRRDDIIQIVYNLIYLTNP